MKKIRSWFYLTVIVCLSIAGFVIRLYQLLRYTDADTGLVITNTSLSYYIYLLFAIAFVFAFLYSHTQKKQEGRIVLRGNTATNIVTAFLCAAFFWDFLYRSSLLYEYITSSDYTELSYIILDSLTLILALLCCFYCVMSLMYFRGTDYKFQKLGIAHFFPVLWALCRMIKILTQIMDIDESAESFCEFLFLTMFLCFSFSLILYFDSGSKSALSSFRLFALMLFFSSVVTAVPRIIVLISGRSFLLYNAYFSSITYMIIGIYALTAVLTIKPDYSDIEDIPVSDRIEI